MRSVLIGVIACVTSLPLLAQPTFSQDVGQMAQTMVQRLVKEEYSAIVATFDEQMRASLPEEKLRAAWRSILTQAGAFQRMDTPRVTTKGDYRIVVIAADFANTKTEIQIAFDRSGQVAGFTMRPVAPPKPFVDAFYVDRTRLVERDVTVDAGGWPLPGTLTVPTGPGPFAAVVLVHGSGPNDRDETVGPNKPFRDLGHGLASQGIAVLRYEKRTRQHAAKAAGLREFTVKEETIEDAAAAVKLLQATPGIDARRVFVLGHSLGGMLAPRIATAAPGIRGLIILAGAVRSLEQSIVDQVRYISMADGVISAEEQTQLDTLQKLVERVKTLKATDPPEGTATFKAPASYWVDLRGYDPPAVAQQLKMPMLILQGERDYQVTMDDFAKWKAALGSRRDAVLKSYPALNHLFIAGTGRSMPAEYTTAAHVAEEVIRDIATWIATQK